jgi:hypothetical protein
VSYNDKIIVNVSNGAAFLALGLVLAIGAGLGGFFGALIALPFAAFAQFTVGLKVHDMLSLYFWEREQAQDFDANEDVEVVDLDV